MMFLSHPAAKGCHIMKLEVVEMFRRERIYPFRPRSGITAPNYLTKGQVIRISSQIYDKNIRKSGFADGMSKPIPKGVYGPFPVQRASDVHRRFGTDKSVPYEHIPTYSNLHVGEIMEKGLYFSSKSCKLSRKKRGVD